MDAFRDWKLFLLVAVFGCIGATVAFAIQATELIQIAPSWDHPWIKMVFQIMIGAFASTVFIFLLSNTDRSDLLRLVSLSMVAGFLWSPVVEIIKKYELVNKASQQETANLRVLADRIQVDGAASEWSTQNDLTTFIEDYTRWRPILSPSDAVKADSVFEGVITRLNDSATVNVPDTSLEMLEAFRLEFPGVEVVESFPGISGSL